MKKKDLMMKDLIVMTIMKALKIFMKTMEECLSQRYTNPGCCRP